jgi:hypothetical protein
MTPHRRFKLAAILPSLVVVGVHFRLSLLLAPWANQVFQHRFDTGEGSTGADATVYSVYNFLSIPIPAILFAQHPARPVPLTWWLITILNSLCWGAVTYGCFILGLWIVTRFSKTA